MSLMIRCNVTGLTTYIFPEGGQYVGEWKNDKPNGQGTLTFPDGEIQTGTWCDGKYIEEKVNSLC